MTCPALQGHRLPSVLCPSPSPSAGASRVCPSLGPPSLRVRYPFSIRLEQDPAPQGCPWPDSGGHGSGVASCPSQPGRSGALLGMGPHPSGDKLFSPSPGVQEGEGPVPSVVPFPERTACVTRPGVAEAVVGGQEPLQLLPAAGLSRAGRLCAPWGVGVSHPWHPSPPGGKGGLP